MHVILNEIIKFQFIWLLTTWVFSYINNTRYKKECMVVDSLQNILESQPTSSGGHV